MRINKYKVVIFKIGSKAWTYNNLYHREDGPAVIYVNGTKMWYLNGRRHRNGAPAVEYANGDKSWYLNGEHHYESEHEGWGTETFP